MKKWEHIGLLGDFGECEDGLIQAINKNFALLDKVIQLAAIDFVAFLPYGPEEGDVYILESDKKIYYFANGDWRVIEPKEGFKAYVASTKKVYRFDGSAWSLEVSGGASSYMKGGGTLTWANGVHSNHQMIPLDDSADYPVDFPVYSGPTGYAYGQIFYPQPGLPDIDNVTVYLSTGPGGLPSIGTIDLEFYNIDSFGLPHEPAITTASVPYSVIDKAGEYIAVTLTLAVPVPTTSSFRYGVVIFNKTDQALKIRARDRGPSAPETFDHALAGNDTGSWVIDPPGPNGTFVLSGLDIQHGTRSGDFVDVTEDIKLLLPGLSPDDNVIPRSSFALDVADGEFIYTTPNDAPGGSLSIQAGPPPVSDTSLVLGYREGDALVFAGHKYFLGESSEIYRSFTSRIQGKPVPVPTPGDHKKALIFDADNDEFKYGNAGGGTGGINLESSPYAQDGDNGWETLGTVSTGQDPDSDSILNGEFVGTYFIDYTAADHKDHGRFKVYDLPQAIRDKGVVLISFRYTPSVDIASGDFYVAANDPDDSVDPELPIRGLAGGVLPAVKAGKTGKVSFLVDLKSATTKLSLSIQRGVTDSTSVLLEYSDIRVGPPGVIQTGPVDRSIEIDITGLRSNTAGTTTWASGSVRFTRSGSLVEFATTDTLTASTSAVAHSIFLEDLNVDWVNADWLMDPSARSGNVYDYSSAGAAWCLLDDLGRIGFRLRDLETGVNQNFDSVSAGASLTYAVEPSPTNIFDAAELELKAAEYSFTPPAALASGTGNINWTAPSLAGAPFTYSNGILTFTRECSLVLTAYVGFATEADGGLTDGNDARIFFSSDNTATSSGVFLQDSRILAAPTSAADRRRTLTYGGKFYPGQYFRVGYQHDKGSDASLASISSLKVLEIPDINMAVALAGKTAKMPEMLRDADQRSVDYDTDEYVPIVASGSNSDGSWIRYADGTQMCWDLTNIPYNNNFSLSGTHTFSLPFASSPRLSTGLGGGGSQTPSYPDLGQIRAISLSSSSVTIQLAATTGRSANFVSGDSANINVIAFGRWK